MQSKVTRAPRHRIPDISAARSGLWDLLDGLRGYAERIEPISQREYVSRALEFSTWDGSDASQLADLERQLLIGGLHTDRHGTALAGKTGADAIAGGTRDTHQAMFFRDYLRRHLAQILAGTSRWDFGRQLYMNVVVLPARPSNKPDQTAPAVFLPRDVSTAIDFSLTLLADPDSTLREDVRLCELKGCGGYFLVNRNPNGGPQPKYHEACRRRLRAKSRHIARRTSNNT